VSSKKASDLKASSAAAGADDADDDKGKEISSADLPNASSLILL
jgi:hypothetical protein